MLSILEGTESINNKKTTLGSKYSLSNHYTKASINDYKLAGAELGEAKIGLLFWSLLLQRKSKVCGLR